MDLTRLRVFRSVMATGSVRGAADVLGYSPASVSQQVARLQRETGLELVRRAGRGIEPTAEGTALAQRLDGLFAEVADVEGYIDGLRTGRRSTLTICYFSSLGSAWMPQLLVALDQEFADLRIDLQVRDEYQPTARLQPDLQLVAQAILETAPPGYRAEPISVDPYVVALPAGHPATSSEQPVSLASLRSQRWIDTNAGHGSCRQITLDACAAAGFRPQLHVQAQDYVTALAMVAAGNGICVLPAIGARPTPDGVQLKRLTDPEPRRHISALVREDVADHLAVRRSLVLIHAAAAATDVDRADGTQ